MLWSKLSAQGIEGIAQLETSLLPADAEHARDLVDGKPVGMNVHDIERTRRKRRQIGLEQVVLPGRRLQVVAA